ncbi:hypothetical protein, partial [Thermogutta sp.]|uniref:hypothetical protein n=1 Tax=Thermogutta sp. TaxID=1962930 RepID=UPI0025F03DC5
RFQPGIHGLWTDRDHSGSPSELTPGASVDPCYQVSSNNGRQPAKARRIVRSSADGDASLLHVDLLTSVKHPKPGLLEGQFMNRPHLAIRLHGG